MRTFLLATTLAVATFSLPAWSQTPQGKPDATTQGTATQGASAKPADPVVATVNGEKIHFSELQAAAQGMPPELRSMPPQLVYPMLLDQVIDRKAVVIEARKAGLDKNPDVQQQMRRAEDNVLENAVLQRDVGPQITEEALHARFDKDYAGKPGETEVHARHILLDSEDQAKQVIAELNKGAKFEDLAKKESKDPAAQNGGDLGFFKKGDMLPEFADAAFALKPGQVSQTPVHTRYGWHVIQVVETRVAPPQTYDQVHDELRQKVIQENVRRVLADARAKVKVERFNPDGSKPKATDTAQPTSK
ncbi:MAG TPA: peptidylprolyl isomerase [Acetobacteraceae bacterium]|nr:peptidylprolyl isomerase [Acetobacteraceae bacterium]